MKRTLALISLALVLFVPAMASAESIAKIGVVDFSKIIDSFPTASQPFQELENMKKDYDAKMAQYNQTLNDMQLKLTTAKNNGDDTQALKLENQIANYQEFIRQYSETKTNQMDIARQKIKDGTGIVQQIYQAIQWVAQYNGYTMVFDASDKNLFWYAQVADITNDVIARLKSVAKAQ